MNEDWLEVRRGAAPLIVSIPHTGLDLRGLEPRLVSDWLARKDADWFVETLYDFVAGFDATIVRTRVSRTVIDVNRDPSGASLYPGQATTGLCPTTSFDGEPLYKTGLEPDEHELAERRRLYFEPYHQTLAQEIARLKARKGAVLIYDCHSIRSLIPRLFDGELPKFNLGTNSGASAAPELLGRISDILATSGESFAIDGRFKGGWITRSFGRPRGGVHALQMELACRAYIDEPMGPVDESNWPVVYRPDYAKSTRDFLQRIIASALEWTREAALTDGA
jgi:N-formylglutamate deformylase